MTEEPNVASNNTTTAHNPEKVKRILIIILILINILFFVFLLTYPGPEIKQIESEITYNTRKLILKNHLFQYVLLKIEIQKLIQDSQDRPLIAHKIAKAIEELETVLNIEDIEKFLEEYKKIDLKNEKRDMERLKRKYL